MKILTLALTSLACGCFIPLAHSQLPNNSTVRFRFTTNGIPVGNVDVELFDTEKPITVHNFLRYVLTDRYTNLFLHRCLPKLVVQGGATAADTRSTNVFYGYGYTRVQTLPAIANEYSVGPLRSNVYGTIAMAKLPGNPDSATSEWFFNLADNWQLDVQNGGFTVFGQVVADNSQVLAHFNSLTNRGIINLGSSTLFTDLPVTSPPNVYPKFNELYSVEIIPLAVRDSTQPHCTIVTPSANLRVTNGAFTATGTATDDLAVKEVRFDLAKDGNSFLTGIASKLKRGTNWIASMTLSPGSNTLSVESFDYAGNRSATQQRLIFCVVLSPLTLALSGQGTVLGATNGQRFEIDRWYSLTAQPAPGQIFSGWSGDITSTNPSISFLMRQGLSLQANFVPAPFSTVKGTYVGLYSQPGQVRHESSGLASFVVNDRGAYTARLNGGGNVFALSGRLDENGRATNLVRRFGTNYFSIEWFLNPSSQTDRLVANLNTLDGSWNATLVADRVWFNAVTNPASIYSGRYTFLVPGSDHAAESPAGDGYGVNFIGRNGYANVGCALADGLAFTQAAPVSQHARWPLYALLYGGRGSIQGWITNAPAAAEDFEGSLTWIRPALPLAKFYRDGFVSMPALTGSRYAPPSNATDRVLNFTDGMIQFSGGNLAAAFTNDVTLNANNSVANLSGNSLALTISTNNGLFTGTVTVPASAKRVSFKGVLHQKRDLGAGFFLDTNQSGQVLFQAR